MAGGTEVSLGADDLRRGDRALHRQESGECAAAKRFAVAEVDKEAIRLMDDARWLSPRRYDMTGNRHRSFAEPCKSPEKNPPRSSPWKGRGPLAG